MKVGLVRHYKVSKGFPRNHLAVGPEELVKWFAEYDEAEIEEGVTDLGGIQWDRCCCSDMPRAVKTAKKIFGESIQPMKELREVPHPHFDMISKRRYPFLWWAILTRLSWHFNQEAQREKKEDVQKRIQGVLDRILLDGDGNVLIVSHAALMMEMRKELLSRGFKGPKFRTPANGALYVFEK